jgi:hypothetical protein
VGGIGDANGFLNPNPVLLGLLLQAIGTISEENWELLKCWL